MSARPDTLYPECHGPYELRLVSLVRLRKACTTCGHSWSEEREASPRVRSVTVAHGQVHEVLSLEHGTSPAVVEG